MRMVCPSGTGDTNTVCVLGNQPEVLSNLVVKNLTRRAFHWQEKQSTLTSVPGDWPPLEPNPDVTDADEDPPPRLAGVRSGSGSVASGLDLNRT
jgi:hypothetical protein